MANKNLFQTLRGAFVPKADTVNSHRAPAYKLAPKQALAQYAATGCFHRTFYATGDEQLQSVVELCEGIDPKFVAKTAVYARERAYMKDTPAFLCAWLSKHDARLHEAVFLKVIDNARMLRNYVQILRSGAVGRKSLGTAPKRLVKNWLQTHSEEAIFRSSAGQSPSIADVLKMVHPKPDTEQRDAFYGYMIGRVYQPNALPPLVRQFESFKSGETLEVPDVPFPLLASMLSRKDWVEVAKRASWQTLRMNLNTFARHGVFEDKALTRELADRLRDADEIRKARVFPYQLLAAFQNCDEEKVPAEIRGALQDAMELALSNVPALPGKVVVCPDVSGSMQSPVTGNRGAGSTSKVRCIDVAALVAAAFLRKNSESTTVIPFEQDVVKLQLNGRDSVMTNAARLAGVGGGGTNCSAPMAKLNKDRAMADLVIYVSDNESWVDASSGGRGTGLMTEWMKFRHRNQKARLVCLDIQPNATTQAVERPDVLNVGGFSDQVFEVISAFASGRLEADHWVAQIEKVAV
jgi:60 kDa SS-A/Ro ribonucleoprotein